MASAVFDNAMVHFGIGEINWSAGQTDIYAMLLTNAYTPNKSGHVHYADVDDVPPQVTDQGGSGYTLGGKNIAHASSLVTAALNGTTCQFDSSDTAWTAATFTTRYAIVYHNAGTPPLISYHDLGSDQQVVNGTLTLQWNSAGVFTIVISDPS